MKWKILILTLLCIGSMISCTDEDPSITKEVVSHKDLAAHTFEFRQEAIAVTEGVYVAIGFGLANSVLLEGDNF